MVSPSGMGAYRSGRMTSPEQTRRSGEADQLDGLGEEREPVDRFLLGMQQRQPGRHSEA